jgi:hypothetical protein
MRTGMRGGGEREGMTGEGEVEWEKGRSGGMAKSKERGRKGER